MTKPVLRYLNNAEAYLEHVLAVWGKYFSSEQEFRDFFAGITADQDKDLFLRVGSFYRFLVLEGCFLFEDKDWNRGMSYIDDSYKYIAIFSLIEALDSPGTYVDFYQWLQRKKKETVLTFAESIMTVISRSYNEYKAEHGSTQAAVRFFSRLDSDDQRLIQDKLEIHRKKSSVKQLAQLLYHIRSQFVHQAKLVLGFSDKTTVGTENGKVVVNKLSMRDIQTIFEHGFLKRFGYQASTQQTAEPDRGENPASG